MFIGSKLKELRRVKDVKQEDIAKILGVSKSSVGHYENGIRQPSAEIVGKLCKMFDVDRDYFYEEDTTKEKDVVRDLIDSLIAEGIIQDPDNISDEVAKLILDAVRMDLRMKLIKEQGN